MWLLPEPTQRRRTPEASTTGLRPDMVQARALKLLRNSPDGSRSSLIRRSRSSVSSDKASARDSDGFRNVTGLRPLVGSAVASVRCLAAIAAAGEASLGAPNM